MASRATGGKAPSEPPRRKSEPQVRADSWRSKTLHTLTEAHPGTDRSLDRTDHLCSIRCYRLGDERCSFLPSGKAATLVGTISSCPTSIETDGAGAQEREAIRLRA